MFLTVCESSSVLSVINFVKALLEIVTTIIPIVLIIMISIDISKIVINTDDKSVKEATKKIVSRSVAAIVIFLIPMLVNLVTDNLGTTRFEESKCWTNATAEKIAVYRAREKAAEEIARKEAEVAKENAKIERAEREAEREKKRLIEEKNSQDIRNKVIPYFQGDYKNRYGTCKDYVGTIARNGCGPTSVAVVATAFKGPEGNDPVTVADWVWKKTSATGCGTGWDMLKYLDHIGVKHSGSIYNRPANLSVHRANQQRIIDALKTRRKLVIVLVGTGAGPGCTNRTINPWTKGAHYFVLTGIDDDGIEIVQVSNRSQTFNKKYDIEHITHCMSEYAIIGED